MQGHKSIQEVFDPHMKEIQRRRLANENKTNANTKFKPSDNTSSSKFELEEQDYVLYSISHSGVPPLSKSDKKGSVRIIGTFPDEDEAKHHAQHVASADPGTSLLISPTREWISILSTMERLGDGTTAVNVRDCILKKHDLKRKKDEEQFNAGRTTETNDSKDNDYDDRFVESLKERAKTDAEVPPNDRIPENGRTARRALPSNVRIAGQRFVAVSFLCDDDDNEFEFIVKVYGCFDDVQEADAWIRNVASPRIQDVDIDIVSTCAWISPFRMILAPKETFRQDELDRIIQHHRSEPERVQEYKKWRDENVKGDGINGSDSVRIVDE